MSSQKTGASRVFVCPKCDVEMTEPQPGAFIKVGHWCPGDRKKFRPLRPAKGETKAGGS